MSTSMPLAQSASASDERRHAPQKPIKVFRDQLYIEPTSVCNLSCGMCYSNVINGAGKRVLGYAEVIDFVGRYFEAVPAPICVYWCGTGEVFLHKEFPRMVNRLLEFGPAIEQTIQTNGTVRRLKELSSLGRIDFNVSIDGPKDVHEWHRGPKTFDRTIAFCNEALDRGCRSLKIRCLLTRDNIERLEEFHKVLTDRLSARFMLELNPPYANNVLRGVREQARAVAQTDIDDSRVITREEAHAICEEKYRGKFEVCVSDTVDNYISVNTYGVHTCCHGILRIGGMEDAVPTLLQRMDDADTACRACAMFPCQ
jgi:MoaA/NifB/PqqE/SkfB family radical SAM enzyme